MATMNISLPDKMKDFVEAKVESGSYSNASGYVPFDPDAFREELRQRAAKDFKFPSFQTRV